MIILIAALYVGPIFEVNRYRLEGHRTSHEITPSEAADLENKFRGTIASLIGGGAVLIGLWFTFQQVVLSGRNARAAEENVRITARSKTLERFSGAVGYLYSQERSRRAAGLAILGASSMSDREDFEPALLILLEYLSERVPFGAKTSNLPADIDVALSQVSRLLRHYQKSDGETFLVRGFDLQNARIRNFYLRDAIVREINLENTFFTNSEFHRVIFTEAANTYAIKFYDCTLTDVIFDWSVKLTFSHFQGSACDRVILQSHDLEGAGLAHATFKDCNMSRVNFRNASLHGTRFDGCDLSFARLDEANFLTIGQLLTAKTLFGATFSKDMSSALEQQAPYLLVSPKRIMNPHLIGWWPTGLGFGSRKDQVLFYKDSSGGYRTDPNGSLVIERCLGEKEVRLDLILTKLGPSFISREVYQPVGKLEDDGEDDVEDDEGISPPDLHA